MEPASAALLKQYCKEGQTLGLCQRLQVMKSEGACRR